MSYKAKLKIYIAAALLIVASLFYAYRIFSLRPSGERGDGIGTNVDTPTIENRLDRVADVVADESRLIEDIAVGLSKGAERLNSSTDDALRNIEDAIRRITDAVELIHRVTDGANGPTP